MEGYEKRGMDQEDIAEIIRKKLELHKGKKIPKPLKKPEPPPKPEKKPPIKKPTKPEEPKEEFVEVTQQPTQVIKPQKKPKQRKTLITITTIIIFLALIGIFITIILLLYPNIAKPEETQRKIYTDENIKEALVINEERAIVKLNETINLNEVESLEIVFSAKDDSIYTYNPTYVDSEYEIYAKHVQLENLQNIIVVRASFTYKQTQNQTPTIISPTNQTPTNTTNTTTTTPSGSGGGGGGGGGTEECTHTCTSLGYECGTQTICGSEVNCGTCETGEDCINGKCLGERLVSYWNFDGNAQDSTGENHGTINGATLTEGISGQAYKFDGISGEINMGDVEPLNGLAQLTVCSWVNLTSQGSSGLIKKSDYGWLLYKSFSDDSMSFYVDDDGEEPWASYISGTTKVNDSRWHHVCGVYGNSTLKLYVDGKSEGTIEGTPPDKLLSNSDPLIIGKWKNSTANASIDEIKIWNYALAKEEINNEYHQVRDKLVSYWNFDGNAQDSTGENHGTINGATLTEGISGQAYKFDGIDDQILIQEPEQLHFKNDFSISFWTKINQFPITDEAFFISKGNEYGIILDETGALAYLFRNSDPGWVILLTSYTFNPETWTHVLLTYELNQTLSIYINGNKIHSRQVQGEMQDYHGNFTIGRRAIYVSEEPFNGTIDEIKIWNYALTQEEAEEVYNQNAPQIFSLSPFRKFWNFIKNLL